MIMLDDDMDDDELKPYIVFEVDIVVSFVSYLFSPSTQQ